MMKLLKKTPCFALIMALTIFTTSCGDSKSEKAGNTESPSTPPPISSGESPEISASEDASTTVVIIKVGDQIMEAELNNSNASATFIDALPIALSMSRWGDGEYYGTIPVDIPSDEEKRDVFEVGEIALWPSGNGFCIFFGPTPASIEDEPRMASPGVPMGNILSNLELLAELDSSVTMEVLLAP